MIKKISKLETIRAKLKKDGKVTSLTEIKHIQAISEMNKKLENMRREFQIKDRNSQTTAASVVLNS